VGRISRRIFLKLSALTAIGVSAVMLARKIPSLLKFKPLRQKLQLLKPRLLLLQAKPLSPVYDKPADTHTTAEGF